MVKFSRLIILLKSTFKFHTNSQTISFRKNTIPKKMKKQILLFLIGLFTTIRMFAQTETVKIPAVAKQIDMMIEHDQSVAKRHIDLMNQNIKSDSPEMRNLMDEWKSVGDVDKIQLKTLFKENGFLGYSEVGEQSSHNFLQMVQRFDDDAAFQQDVLVEMKKHIDKINANPIEFAYLTDRVNLNQGKPQVYGTQLKINEKGNSYEPKTVIDPKNLNKRRAQVGLGTIEEAILVMNNHFAASLKK